MATFPIYVVAKCVSTPSGVSLDKPFFLMETYLTLDGPRTRMCDGRWHTQEAAEIVLKEKMNARQSAD